MVRPRRTSSISMVASALLSTSLGNALPQPFPLTLATPASPVASAPPLSPASPEAVFFDAPALAARLNLTTTWVAEAPTSNNSLAMPLNASPSGLISPSSTDTTSGAFAFLAPHWDLWHAKLYGGSEANLAFLPDPFVRLTEVPAQVLRVQYGQGSYRQNAGARSDIGGATFYPSPAELGIAHRAMLSYQVAFEPGFDFVKGGKLPGLWSGKSASSCSGGHQSGASGAEDDCFSVRMMWRANGTGEVYAYLPQRNKLCPDVGQNATGILSAAPSVPSDSGVPALAANGSTSVSSDVICNDDYGTSLGRGRFNFTMGGYTNVTMYVQLNAPGQSDGVLQVWANGSPVVDLKDLALRDAIAPMRIFFSTFFGGSSPDWASTGDTHTYFKNLRVWADQPQEAGLGEALVSGAVPAVKNALGVGIGLGSTVGAVAALVTSRVLA